MRALALAALVGTGAAMAAVAAEAKAPAPSPKVPADEPPPVIRERAAPGPGPGAIPFQDHQAIQEHMNRIFADMDRLFEDAWGRPFGPGFPGPGRVDPFEPWFRGPGAGPLGFPPGLADPGSFLGGEIDLVEEADRYRARVDVPGIRPGDVRVSIEGATLKISATRRLRKGDRFLRQERAFGTFSRSVELPGPVEAGKLELEFRDGVLHLTIPKKIR